MLHTSRIKLPNRAHCSISTSLVASRSATADYTIDALQTRTRQLGEGLSVCVNIRSPPVSNENVAGKVGDTNEVPQSFATGPQHCSGAHYQQQ